MSTREELEDNRKILELWLRNKKKSNMALDGCIGIGGFSSCWLLKSSASGRRIALKMTNKKNLSETKKLFLKREFEIHRKLRHKNIVHFFGYSSFDNLVFMFIEYCAFGSLSKFISNSKNYTLTTIQIKQTIKQLSEAIYYIHNENIIHRDIKPSNILISSIDKNNIEIKLADFGLSVYNNKNYQKEKCGTLNYLAPEILNKNRYSFPVDVWGIGVVFYLLKLKKLPFKVDEENNTVLYTEKIDFGQCQDDEIDFISSCLRLDQNKRPIALHLLSHPTFVDLYKFKK